MNDFLRRFATIRCCHKNRCNVTYHCEGFSAYPDKRQHVACFWLEFKNSQWCCQNFVKSTSLRNGMLHWNDFQRNIVANCIVENRSVWRYLYAIPVYYSLKPNIIWVDSAGDWFQNFRNWKLLSSVVLWDLKLSRDQKPIIAQAKSSILWWIHEWVQGLFTWTWDS